MRKPITFQSTATLLLLTLTLACKTATTDMPATPATTANAPISSPATRIDPHSYAEADQAVVRHLALDLSVDFVQKRLAGNATLDITPTATAQRIVLDTRDLDISSVSVDGKSTSFTLGDPVEFLGRSLTIPITPSSRRVLISYRTEPQAAALQWLDPSQTAGGKLPFLFTQSQAILARTWVPIQDTPAVRFTYDATIHVPSGFVAVMSAEQLTPEAKDGVYRFRMPQPIPSYLLALAVGDLAFRKFDDRSGVWAEPSVVDKAAWEFADTPKMIAAAEKLYGPYRWGRYDVLVLPPSFPFGGMENPRLTFATPTVLAGDRSLVALVAHELAHSWSGNLVTNATWNDFWLNEGFTVYFERRIMEAVYGREYSEMGAALGLHDLNETLKELGETSKDTQLKLDLAGRDPDEGVSDIAYEKGYLLLRMLEEAVGRDQLDPFLSQYFSGHAFRSMTTEGFLEYLDRNLLSAKPELQARVREFVYKPGLPAFAPAIRSTRFERVDAEVKRFAEGAAASTLKTKDWSAHEWLRFVNELPSDLSRSRIAELDRAFGFTKSGNQPLLSAWLVRTIRAGYSEANSALERFLTTVGRRLLIKPIYTELVKTPAGTEYARRIYAKARPGYHAVSRETLDKIVNNAQ